MNRLIKKANIDYNLLELSKKDFITYINSITLLPIPKINNIIDNIYKITKNEDLARMMFIDYLTPRGFMFNK